MDIVYQILDVVMENKYNYIELISSLRIKHEVAILTVVAIYICVCVCVCVFVCE